MKKKRIIQIVCVGLCTSTPTHTNKRKISQGSLRRSYLKYSRNYITWKQKGFRRWFVGMLLDWASVTGIKANVEDIKRFIGLLTLFPSYTHFRLRQCSLLSK